jgi:hypothetical protein
VLLLPLYEYRLGDAITLSNCEHHTSLPAHTGLNDRLPEADSATLNSSSSISRLSHTSDVHVDGRVVENIIERFQRGMDVSIILMLCLALANAKFVLPCLCLHYLLMHNVYFAAEGYKIIGNNCLV